jgi:hypothetical protein
MIHVSASKISLRFFAFTPLSTRFMRLKGR